MRALALVALLAVSATAWAAKPERHDEAPSLALLPGSDVDTTPFARWRDGLVLIAPPDASLSIEDALRIVHESEAPGRVLLELGLPPQADWRYHLTITKEDGASVNWDVAADRAMEITVDPHEVIRVGLRAEIATGAEGERTLILEATLVPDASFRLGDPG